MKKLVLSLLCLLLLCSCSSGEIKPRLEGITFAAEMTYFNEVYNFDGELKKGGELVAKMTAPKELADLVLTVNDKGVTADYKGLTYSPVEGSLPFSSLLCDLHAPIVQIISQGLTADGEGRLTVGKEAEEFTLTVSPTGLPQSLELMGGNFKLKFLSTTIKEDLNE